MAPRAVADAHVLLLHGEESFLVEEEAKRVLDAWRADPDADVPPVAQEELRRAAEELADRRTRSLALLEGLLAQTRRAEDEADLAARRLEDAEGELAAQAERHADAQEQLAAAGSQHAESVRAYLNAPGELDVPDPQGALDALADWIDTLSGPSPARSAVGATAQAATAAHAAEQAALDAAIAEARARRDESRRELAELEAGGQQPPAAPSTRDEPARATLPGAPLWRLVDFADDATADQRAGIEAALEAAGLLDAWITPEGTALGADTHDVLLVPGPPAASPSLADLLRPAAGLADPRAAAVPEQTVARLLAGIALAHPDDPCPDNARADSAEHPTWICTDGRFRNGPAHGAWAKPAAQYIGESAREARASSRRL